MASELTVANRALQKLGASYISSLEENSRDARAIKNAFEPLRDAFLRRHPWNFAKTRASIAADVTLPAFGWGKAYSKPSDWIRWVDEDQPLPYPDYSIEGSKIYMNRSGALNLTYIKRVTDMNQWDSLALEAFSAYLALELCEEITQSNTKKDSAQADFELAMREAKKANAWESPARETPIDPWVLARGR